MTVQGATVDTENIKTEETVIEVNGQATDAFSITVPFTMENSTATEIEVEVPKHTGYTYSDLKKSSRAGDEDAMADWLAQANAYFNSAIAGYKTTTQKMIIQNPKGYAVKGYRVIEYFVTKELTFECGMNSELWTGKITYSVGIVELKPIYVNDNHDDHDDHDDHGGTSWGGGTSGH